MSGCYLEQAVLSLAGQRHLHIALLSADVSQVLLGVEIAFAVENRSLVDEQLWLGLHERVENVAVNTLGAFIRLDRDCVMIDEALGNLDSEVVGAELDGLSLGADGGPGRRRELKAEGRRRLVDKWGVEELATGVGLR